MRQVIVGTYHLGFEQVQLVLREGTGGEFYSSPGRGECARIKVGAQESNQWGAVLAVLLHEVWEIAMFRAHARYSPDNRVNPTNHADYLFVMDHQEFHDCCAKAAEFLVEAVPALATAYKDWHKKPAPAGRRKNRRKS